MSNVQEYPLSGQQMHGYVLRGLIGTLGLRVLAAGLSLAISVLLARTLGASGYGVYAYALSLVSLLAIFAGLGLSNLVTRELAIYQAKGAWGLIKGLLRRANQAVFGLSLLLMFAAATFAWIFRGTFNAGALGTYFMALVLLPLVVLNSLREAALRGFGLVVLANLPELLLRPAGFVVLIVLCALLLNGAQKSPVLAMGLQVLATAFALLAGVLILRHELRKRIAGILPDYDLSHWVKSTLPFFLMGIIQTVNSQIDVLLLGLFRSSGDVALYRIALNGASLVILVRTAIDSVIAPRVAALYHNNERVKLQQLVSMSGRVILLAAGAFALVLVLFGRELLQSVFGQEFVAAYPALVVVALGHFVCAAMGPVGYLLNMTGHEREMMQAMIALTVVNATLNLILIPAFGLIGSALATGTGLAGWHLLLAWQASRLTGVCSWKFLPSASAGQV